MFCDYVFLCICLTQADTRIANVIPPPHNHCFITERNLSNFSASNVTQNFICDQHLLVLLSLALQRATAFERCYDAHSEYTQLMLRAKATIETISQALSNITRVSNDDLVNGMCGLPSLSSLSSPPSARQNQRCLGSNSLQGSDNGLPEDRSRPGQLRSDRTPSNDGGNGLRTTPSEHTVRRLFIDCYFCCYCMTKNNNNISKY